MVTGRRCVVLLAVTALACASLASVHAEQKHSGYELGLDRRAVSPDSSTNFSTPALSSNGGWGIEIWSSAAAGIRKMFQGSFGSKDSSVTAQRILMGYIRSLVLMGFLILSAFASIAVAIIVSCFCLGKPRKSMSLGDQDRTYVSIGAVVVSTFAIFVCIITGIRGSAYLTTSINTFSDTLTVVPLHVRSSLDKVPRIINDTVDVLSSNLNNTIDAGVFMAVDVQRMARALGSYDSINGPGTNLLDSLRILTWLVGNFTANTTEMNSLAVNISVDSNTFYRDLAYLQRNITQINLSWASIANPTLRFELLEKLPTVNSTPEVSTLSNSVTASSSNAITPASQTLSSLPDFPGIYATIDPLFQNVSDTINNLARNYTDGPKIEIGEKILEAGRKARVESVNVTVDIQEDVDGWKNDIMRYLDDGKGGGILYYNGIRAVVTALLFASAGLMITLIVVSIFVKKPIIVSIALPNMAILTFLFLVIGAVFFMLAVILSDVVTEKGAVITSLSKNNMVENFFVGRDQCIENPTKSLVSFARQVGVNTDALNLTMAAAPSIEALNLSAIANLNFSTILPPALSIFRNQSIPALFSSLNSTLRLDLFAPLRSSNLSILLQSIENIKITTNSFRGGPSNYTNRMVSIPAGAAVTAADLQGFDRALSNVVLMTESVERSVRGVEDGVRRIVRMVDYMAEGVRIGQNVGESVPVYLNATLNLLNQFSQEINQNVGPIIVISTWFNTTHDRHQVNRYAPIAKRMLYDSINSDYEKAISELPCNVLAADTVVLQDSVCVGVNESFDIMCENGKRRKFGKAEYTIKETRHADDLLPSDDIYTPEWNTGNHPLGSNDTFEEPTSRSANYAESYDHQPPSPVLSSMSAVRGRPGPVTLVTSNGDEIRVMPSRRASDVPRKARSPSVANYFKE
ncbi:hypothetical protein HDU67_003553 [Dinochytrium kinnereticum]|nr:hypothetical protein HDU67_003553 [Dinochytrium kinnereticum]